MRGMDSMLVFDRLAVRRHRDRAAATVGSVADVLRDAAERLVERLDDTTRRFSFALDVGGRGVVAPLLRARGIAVVSCDLSARMASVNGGVCVAADEELLRVEGSGRGGVSVRMEGPRLASRAVDSIAELIRQTAQRHELPLAELAGAIIHGGNGRMPALVAKRAARVRMQVASQGRRLSVLISHQQCR